MRRLPQPALSALQYSPHFNTETIDFRLELLPVNQASVCVCALFYCIFFFANRNPMATLSQVARVESPFFAAHSSPTRKKTDPYLLLSSWATGALTFSLYLSLYSHRHQRWFSLMRISPQFHYSSDAFIDQIYFNRFASTQYNLQKNRKMRSTGSKN